MKRKAPSLHVLFIVSLVLLVGGWLGLSLAIRVYPQSNLLGGWGLILGPIYWLGQLLLVVAVIWWVVRELRSRINRKAGDDA